MDADQFLQLITQVLYVTIFVLTARHAWHRPDRARLHIAILFGMLSLIIAQQWATSLLHVTPGHFFKALSGSLMMGLPYLLMRLLSDYTTVTRYLLRAASLGLALSVILLFAIEENVRPPWILGFLVLYLVGFGLYVGYAFVHEARHSSGVTARRMEAVAIGTTCIGLLILMVPFQLGFPRWSTSLTLLSRLLGLASGIAYFLGFAPPAWLRRAWQEPDLRALLVKITSFPWLPDTGTIIQALQRGTAVTTGAAAASIGLWNETEQSLVFHGPDGIPLSPPPPFAHFLTTQVLAAQKPFFSANASHDDPQHTPEYRDQHIVALLAAPITTGERRIGLLAIYTSRAPIFAEDDLSLVQLVADQAAMIFENRRLMEEATRVRAREETARLKDDFLSAAAHDLKTPLTGLITQIEVLERKALRKPDAPVDINAVHRLQSSARRLSTLVLELLDVGRLESGRFVMNLEPIDLSQVLEECCAAVPLGQQRLQLELAEPVVRTLDRTRIKQVMSNLIENAIKYSPGDDLIQVRLWHEDLTVHFTVTDSGIGIPPGDLPSIFDRFHRASNVDDRRFAGMGLGLYICRGIVEQHGGRIWATSTVGRGSTFHVMIPAASTETAT